MSLDDEGEQERGGGPLGLLRDQTNPDPDVRDASVFDPPTYDDPLAAPPRSIGRFVILRRLGRGSMGEVFSAFDEALGRRVAIKLLQRQPRARESRRGRMRREAQAMAQVSHPNVVQVFEAGEHGGRMFIAMEYVEGQTLERWQRGTQAHPRTREAILDAYLQAGAGLAAAHRAGVLHRDFKPANVLVDADGRVHVMDFGLAAWLRRGDSTSTGPGSSGDDDPPAALDGLRLTRAGALVGTPAFMSPEQYRGQELDARSDQFSFCVALWEALVGSHPFDCSTIDALREAILEGEVRDEAAARSLPSGLRRALLRGLAKPVHERWPDMDALLLALRPRPRRTRWPWAAAAVVVLAAVGGVTVAVTRSGAGLCEGGQQQLVRVWGDERRAAAREGMTRTGTALAESTWRRVEHDLDAYAEGWLASRQRVCEATHVHGEQSAALMDERMACLGQRLDAMGALVDGLAAADLEVVLRAVDAGARLPELGACETTGVGARADAEIARPEAVELRRRLASALAHLELGRKDDAHAELEALRDEALRQGLPRLAAEVLVHRGLAEQSQSRLPTADATLEAALWEALGQGHDAAAFEAAAAHARLVGAVLGDEARGRAGLVRMDALLVRQGEPEAERLERLVVSGTVLGRHGDYREARTRLQSAVELAERRHGAAHPAYADALNALGMVMLWGGDHAEAQRVFGELVELDRELYDPQHVAVASALNNLAIASANLGDLGAAQARFQEAFEVRRATLGERHVLVGDSLMNLGGVVRGHEPQAALRYIERARAIYAELLGEEAAKTNDADLARAMLLVEQDRPAEAEPILRAVVAHQRRALGEHHPDLGRTLAELGRLLLRPGDAAEAAALLRSAVAIRRASLAETDVPPDQDALLRGLQEDLATAEGLAGREPAAGTRP